MINNLQVVRLRTLLLGCAALLAASTWAQTASTTLLVSSAAATVVGQNVTLTATVTGSSPSGTVTFVDGSTSLGAAVLSGGLASFSTSTLAQGSHSVSATYAGDANNTASTSSAVSVTVSARPAMVWQYGYDAMGRLNTRVDPNAQTSYFYYDSLGRMVQSQQPPNTGSSSPTLITYGWDAMDTLTSVQDPRNLTTSYTATGLGTVTAEASPDRGGSSYTYDAKGNVLTRTDARGKTTTYTYDSLDRLISISYPTGVGTTFEYDGGASKPANEAGELTKITDESGQSVYVHDAMGRLITKTVTIGGKTFTVSYGWGDTGSALDKLASITYPGGSKVNYSYAANGMVSGITVNVVNPNGSGQSATSQTLLSGITYNVDARPTDWMWSDGKARTIGYDSYGQISSYALGDPNGTGTTRTLTRDSAGRITGYTHTNNGAAQTSLDQGFAYDNLNRLTRQTVNGTSYGFTYDATGNRTSKVIGGNTYTNTVAANSNRYTQTQDVTGTVSPQYDAAGNTTSDGANTFTYSDRGRMSSAVTSSGNMTMLYDAWNQRAYKSSSLGTSYYVHDETGQLLGEYDGNGTPIYETVYLGSVPVGVIKQGTLYNVYADQIDTPRVITKQDHTIVWRWDTAEAFGATAPNDNPSGLGVFAYYQGMPGQVRDLETGLYDNGFRTYDGRVRGGYLQVDRLGLQGGSVSPYPYAGANPLSYIDPLGLMKLPNDPSGLPPEWKPDPSHRDPNGERFRGPNGDILDWHKGRPGMPGWRGKDHWHHNNGDEHLPPGSEVPDTCPPEEPSLFDRLKNALMPPPVYDPRRDLFTPAPRPRVYVFPLP